MKNFKLLSHLVLPAIICLLPAALAGGKLASASPWIAFAFGFVLLASQPSPDTREMTDATAADRRSALWIYLGMALPQLVASVDYAFLKHMAPTLASPWVVGGLVLGTASLAFRISAIRTLGRFFTATVQVQNEHRVIDVGPYRLLRHPSYTGALGVVVGTSLAFHSAIGLVLVAALSVPAYHYRMTVEEQELAKQLGPAYEAYMKRTKRLVPYVY